MTLSDLQVGDTLEYIVLRSRDRKYQRKGEIIQITKKCITVNIGRYRETINIVDINPERPGIGSVLIEGLTAEAPAVITVETQPTPDRHSVPIEATNSTEAEAKPKDGKRQYNPRIDWKTIWPEAKKLLDGGMKPVDVAEKFDMEYSDINRKICFERKKGEAMAEVVNEAGGRINWDITWPQVQAMLGEGKTVEQIIKKLGMKPKVLKSKMYHEERKETANKKATETNRVVPKPIQNERNDVSMNSTSSEDKNVRPAATQNEVEPERITKINWEVMWPLAKAMIDDKDNTGMTFQNIADELDIPMKALHDKHQHEKRRITGNEPGEIFDSLVTKWVRDVTLSKLTPIQQKVLMKQLLYELKLEVA